MAVGVVAGFCEWGTPQPTRTAESWLQVLQVLQVGVYYHVWGWPDWLCCATEASKGRAHYVQGAIGTCGC